MPPYDIWHTAYDMCASRVGFGVGVDADADVGESHRLAILHRYR